jgi:hypothetical protein
VDTKSLEGNELQEYEEDLQESNRRYKQAYNTVLSHTSKVELESFWSSFGGSNKVSLPSVGSFFSNPLHDKANDDLVSSAAGDTRSSKK